MMRQTPVSASHRLLFFYLFIIKGGGFIIVCFVFTGTKYNVFTIKFCVILLEKGAVLPPEICNYLSQIHIQSIHAQIRHPLNLFIIIFNKILARNTLNFDSRAQLSLEENSVTQHSTLACLQCTIPPRRPAGEEHNH